MLQKFNGYGPLLPIQSLREPLAPGSAFHAYNFGQKPVYSPHQLTSYHDREPTCLPRICLDDFYALAPFDARLRLAVVLHCDRAPSARR